jgi:hypothetical protein
LYASLRYGSPAQRLPFTATPDRAFIHFGVEHRLEETKDNLERQEIGDGKPAESTPSPPRVSRHSHSIVQQTRKGLFSFIKSVQPPRFSRQPYRQKFGLLISLENFERWKISPIAVYRN